MAFEHILQNTQNIKFWKSTIHFFYKTTLSKTSFKKLNFYQHRYQNIHLNHFDKTTLFLMRTSILQFNHIASHNNRYGTTSHSVLCTRTRFCDSCKEWRSRHQKNESEIKGMLRHLSLGWAHIIKTTFRQIWKGWKRIVQTLFFSCVRWPMQRQPLRIPRVERDCSFCIPVLPKSGCRNWTLFSDSNVNNHAELVLRLLRHTRSVRS